MTKLFIATILLGITSIIQSIRISKLENDLSLMKTTISKITNMKN